MVLTRAQMENMTKEELIEELSKTTDISDKLDKLTVAFEDFTAKYNMMNSELAVVKKVNSLLINNISTLERNQLNSSQYHRRQMIEINPISPSISDANLEQSVCDALSLIGSKISPENLQSCHRMKADTVFVLFKDRKLCNKVYFNRNNLKGKEAKLKELGFSGKLYVSDFLCIPVPLLQMSSTQKIKENI